MSTSLEAIKTKVEQSLPSDLRASLREAGIAVTLDVANGSRSLVDISDALAEREWLWDMSSFGKKTTGVDHNIFVSTNMGVQHGPRIKVAIDPPNSFSPRCVSASVSINDGQVVAGEIRSAALLKQVREFIELNREALIEFWNCQIGTDELHDRLRSIGEGRR
jgi:hypothetical protein